MKGPTKVPIKREARVCKIVLYLSNNEDNLSRMLRAGTDLQVGNNPRAGTTLIQYLLNNLLAAPTTNNLTFILDIKKESARGHATSTGPRGSKKRSQCVVQFIDIEDNIFHTLAVKVNDILLIREWARRSDTNEI